MTPQQRWVRNNPHKVAEKNRQSHAKLRADAYAAYGTSCRCCGEAEPAFLAIDHIVPVRRKNRNGPKWLRDLRKQGFPPGYQTLCHNCNMGKERYGVCPHQVERDLST